MAREQRRLAAIVAADVAGYSRLIGADEEGTLGALRSHRKELINPLIEQYGGRIANTAGDSLLLEFPSAVDAVRCAVAVQDGMAERNGDVEPDRRIAFRIGINVGDVVAEGGDLLGDDVNIAARLEGICEPGEVVLSDDAHRQVRNRVSTEFRDEGLKSLKNIAEPVRAWCWSQREEPSRAVPAREPLPLPDKPSIVVLPFNNMSGDPEQEFLADGLSEDITTALSQHRWLFVIARNSAFTYKGAAADISQVSQDLGVRYVLEGSVRKSGDRIRATAQLIDAETQSHVWAERYDQMLVDVFDLQDEITASIVGAIEPNLLTAERERLDRKRPTSLNAWEFIVKAMPFLLGFRRGAVREAIEFLSQALDLDPNYARAYSLLACGYAFDLWSGRADDHGDAALLAEQNARRSIDLDTSDPWAHLAMGMVRATRRESQEALLEFDTTIKLNPNFALAYAFRGIALAWGGRSEEALECFDLAERLSPHDPFNAAIPGMRGAAFFAAHRFDEAMVLAREAVRLKPEATGVYRILAASCAMAGMQDEAQAAMNQLKQVQPSISTQWVYEKMPIADKAFLELFVEALVKAGLTDA